MKFHNLIYALYDDVADNVLQYYICPDSVWAERTFRTLCQQITCGVPSEFSFRLVGALDDLAYISADDVLNSAKADAIDCKDILRGSDYERMADNV